MNDCTIDSLIAEIPDGATVAIPPSRSGAAMAATRALIARGISDLHLIAVPTSGVQADMLIGAGCVAVMESAGVTLDEYGQAPRFVAAVKAGSIKLKDSTCPAIISAIQAGEKGIPFMPVRGLIGSDIVTHREEYLIIQNPVSAQKDPILVLPAISPDYALFHAPCGDRHGNVWIGKARELMTMAHAARHCLVTVEKIVDGDLMQDDLRAPATIPEIYLSKVAVAKHGAWPLELPTCYSADGPAVQTYVRAAQTAEGFTSYMAGQHQPRTAAQ